MSPVKSIRASGRDVPSPHNRENLELVPQSELHHARLREQAGVISERLRHLLQRSNAGTSLRSQARQHIEAVQIGDVKNFPTKLQAVALPYHLPPLAPYHIPPPYPTPPHPFP